jgi:hypothetical protein
MTLARFAGALRDRVTDRGELEAIDPLNGVQVVAADASASDERDANGRTVSHGPSASRSASSASTNFVWHAPQTMVRAPPGSRSPH